MLTINNKIFLYSTKPITHKPIWTDALIELLVFSLESSIIPNKEKTDLRLCVGDKHVFYDRYRNALLPNANDVGYHPILEVLN